ncbi:MAG: carboxypeptidase regulatory-like domain-containing protein [Candidatus Cloacimonetes bacterium]|nr:carboxypeptidase regulatory-like domain-containing protein [Candidatus Cloacimonadota bacterium]
MKRLFSILIVLTIFLSSLMAIEVTIGAGDQQALIPVNMYYRNSLFETIYLSEELNIGGMITGIKFYNNFQDNLPNKPTNIWLGETARTNLSNGWIPSSALTQVFAGDVIYPPGNNDIVITFTTPFFYSGENLVMMVQRPYEQDYYGPSDYFYCQTVGNNRSLMTYNDNSIIEPTNPPTTGVTGQFPKTTFMVTVTGMGSLNGIVTVNGSPLDGATVTVSNSVRSYTTGADGSYSFPYIPTGEHTITASKIGYSIESSDVTIVENQTTTEDFNLTLLGLVTVNGRIVGSDAPDIGIATAELSLYGYASFTTLTDANGNFVINDVYAGQTYNYEITADSYQVTSGLLTVGETDMDAGNLIVNELAYPPMNVLAVEDSTLSTVTITWEEPIAAEEGWLAYDNGENYTSFGTGGSLSFDVAIRFPASDLTDYAGGYLQAVKIWPATGGNFSVRVWTGGTATEPGTMVVDQPIIPVLNSWNTIILNTPVPITGTEELWFGFLCDVTGVNPAYAGVDEGPAVNGFSNMIYWQGNWTTLLAVNSYCNFNWNIEGYAGMTAPSDVRDLIPLSANGVTNLHGNNRQMIGYNVFRLLEGTEESHDNWQLVGEEAITDTMIVDTEWFDVAPAIYRWAVQTVYTGGVVSDYSFTDTIERSNMYGTVTGIVYTSPNIPIVGAVVSFGDEIAITSDTGTYFRDILAGTYTVTCTADGYVDYIQEDVVITADQTHTINIQMDVLANQESCLPLITRLNNNYPNPFNPETTFSFDIKERCKVTLDIFNIKGQLVHSLMDEMVNQGSHSVIWNGKDVSGKTVSSGVYYYRLQAGEYTATKCMVLMK